MSLKEDVKELEENINELAEETEKHCFAYELLQDAKKTIRGLEIFNKWASILRGLFLIEQRKNRERKQFKAVRKSRKLEDFSRTLAQT